MWGYREIDAFAASTADPIYREWASFYSSDDYERRVAAVLDVLDRYEVTPDMLRAFLNSVRFEIMFWEAALRMEPTIY